MTVSYKPKQYYLKPEPPVPPSENEGSKVKVYWKKDDKKLGQMNANNMHHHDAIIAVQSDLLASGEGYNVPVLALIQGGKA